MVRLPDPVVAVGDGWIEAEVITVDRFGNVQLAAGGAHALRARPGPGDRRRQGPARPRPSPTPHPGELIVYEDSAGRVAIAVNGGRAVVVLLRSAPATWSGSPSAPDHMWQVEVPLGEFYDQILEAGRRAGYLAVLTALVRDADSERFYEDVCRYWDSLHDVTGPDYLFVLAGPEASVGSATTGFAIVTSRSSTDHRMPASCARASNPSR